MFYLNYANPSAESLLTAILLKPKHFAEMEPLKGICHNKMYTLKGFSINEINCDDNGAYEEARSVKKEYVVEQNDGKLTANVVRKEGGVYMLNARSGRTYEKTVVDPKKVYVIERYYRKNKSIKGLRHMVVRVKNVTKVEYEDFFCVIYSYDENSRQESFQIMPHGNSKSSNHPYIRTSQAVLEKESRLLEGKKPSRVYDELVVETNPLISSSQSKEPRNLKQVQNVQYSIHKRSRESCSMASIFLNGYISIFA